MKTNNQSFNKNVMALPTFLTRILLTQRNTLSPMEMEFYFLNAWSDTIFMNFLLRTQGVMAFLNQAVKAFIKNSLLAIGLKGVFTESKATSLVLSKSSVKSAVAKYYTRNHLLGSNLAISTLAAFTKAASVPETALIVEKVPATLFDANVTGVTLNGIEDNFLVEKTAITYPLFSPKAHWEMDNKTVFSTYGHPFHLVDPSPWPFCTSMGLWYITFTTVAFFHKFLASPLNIVIGFIYLGISLAFWWRDVIRESTYEVKHTPYVRRGLLNGMLLFIVSEIMFFFGFFWAFFHSSLSPSHYIGGIWPPLTIEVISPWQLPLVNTLCLLLSGVTLTIAHRQLNGLPYYNQTVSTQWPLARRLVLWLQVTIFLGAFFLCCQAVEYYLSPFTFQDTVFGGTFYILTGLHGMHVIVGTIFLIICLWRASRLHFTMWKQVGFKSAVWYWHFVDVVWIFLFIVIYVWGGLSVQ